MPLITPAPISALQVGFHGNFRQGYGDSQPWSTALTTPIMSSNASELYGHMGRILAMRQWVGPRLLRDLESFSQTVVNLPFENTISVKQEHLADDSLGVYAPLFQELGRSGAKWPDQLLKTRLQANGNGFDGQAYFSATHDIDPAGNQDNDYAATALTAANYAIVRGRMTGYTGEDGEPLGVMPNLLIVPPQLEVTAKTIVVASELAGGGTNVNQGSAQVLVVPELANQATTWYLADVSKPIKPWIFQLRKAINLVMKDGPADDNVFWDGDLVYGIDSRGNVAPGPWWLMSRSVA